MSPPAKTDRDLLADAMEAAGYGRDMASENEIEAVRRLPCGQFLCLIWHPEEREWYVSRFVPGLNGIYDWSTAQEWTGTDKQDGWRYIENTDAAAPAAPLVTTFTLPDMTEAHRFRLSVVTHGGNTMVLRYLSAYSMSCAAYSLIQSPDVQAVMGEELLDNIGPCITLNLMRDKDDGR